MNRSFNGPLHVFMKQHLALRRSLGFILNNAELALYDFDQYLLKNFPHAQTVTRPMVLGYLQTLHHLHPCTLYDRVVHLRQFCRFVFQLNPETYIPEKRLIPPGVTFRKPYIYPEREVKDIIRRSAHLPPSGSLRPLTYVTLISLLNVTGLRVGEALRLNLEDVNTQEAILHIRQSKFYKSRLVPLTLSAASALDKYRERRAEHGHDQKPTAPFFVNERARRCNYSTVSRTFREMVRQLDIQTAQGYPPRLHDFRHTFATRYLWEIYQGEKDPNAALPFLATYLGHVNIACTQVYLHPSTQLLKTAGERFFEHVRR